MDADWRLVANKTGASRLGFVALLKFFELEGRFPRHAGELPPAAVGYLAGQVRVGGVSALARHGHQAVWRVAARQQLDHGIAGHDRPLHRRQVAVAEELDGASCAGCVRR
jgi:hypothetical protein